jgi:hypothetical protein
LAPQLATTLPLGVIVPPVPADAEIVFGWLTDRLALFEMTWAEHEPLTMTLNCAPLSPTTVAGVV